MIIGEFIIPARTIPEIDTRTQLILDGEKVPYRNLNTVFIDDIIGDTMTLPPLIIGRRIPTNRDQLFRLIRYHEKSDGQTLITDTLYAETSGTDPVCIGTKLRQGESIYYLMSLRGVATLSDDYEHLEENVYTQLLNYDQTDGRLNLTVPVSGPEDELFPLQSIGDIVQIFGNYKRENNYTFPKNLSESFSHWIDIMHRFFPRGLRDLCEGSARTRSILNEHRNMSKLDTRYYSENGDDLVSISETSGVSAIFTSQGHLTPGSHVRVNELTSYSETAAMFMTCPITDFRVTMPILELMRDPAGNIAKIIDYCHDRFSKFEEMRVTKRHFDRWVQEIALTAIEDFNLDEDMSTLPYSWHIIANEYDDLSPEERDNANRSTITLIKSFNGMFSFTIKDRLNNQTMTFLFDEASIMMGSFGAGHFYNIERHYVSTELESVR